MKINRRLLLVSAGILVSWPYKTGIVMGAGEPAGKDQSKEMPASNAAQPASQDKAAVDAGASGGAPGESSEQASTNAPEAALPSVTSTGEGQISVDFKDADIRQVLRIISLKSGVDIVAGTDVEGLVTIKLSNVPWEQALDIILRTYGLTYERKGPIIRVMTVSALEKEALATEVFPLDYAKAKDVPDVLKEMLSERGRVKFDDRTNTIIVTDIPTNLYQIKQVIGRLDQRTPQVLIETKIVETKLDKNENLGIDWSDSLALTQSIPSVSSTFPFTPNASFGTLGAILGTQRAAERPGSTISLGVLSSSAGLSATLNFLQRRTDTHIVSNPSIAVLNNHEATVHIGNEFPIPNYTIDASTGRVTLSGYTPKQIGTVLTVTPHVNPSGEIVADLKPQIIAATSNVSYSTGQNSTVELPNFIVQDAQTQVRIKSGETIAIGGLVKTSETKLVAKVPVIADIPIIGLFFKNTSRYTGTGTTDPVRQDLIIFLTVKLDEKDAQNTKAVAAAVVNDEPRKQ